MVEPSVIESGEERFQFEREGYFYKDPIDYSDKTPIFNKIVSLKDSWAKKKKPQPSTQKAKPKPKQIDGEVKPMTLAEQELFNSYTNELKLNSEVANTLARDKELSSFFNKTLEVYSSPATIANLVTNDVARELKQKSIEKLKFSADDIANLTKMIDEETISTKIAKDVFEIMSQSGNNPVDIVEQKGLKQISNPEEILPIIDEIISKNPENVAKYKVGNTKLFGFFVGQVLKATGGKTNPKVVNKLVKEKLK